MSDQPHLPSLHAMEHRSNQVLPRWAFRSAAASICAALVLFWIFIAIAQRSEGSTPCEHLVYDGTEKVLFIEDAYYTFPRRSDGLLVTLSVRYRDLEPSDSDAPSDVQALNDPLWSIEHSDETALLYIYRSSFKWPSTVGMLREVYQNGSVIETDWPGWVRFVRCTTNCSSAVYISEHWKTLRVDSVECRESKTVDPLDLSCWASDHVSGIPVQYYFPSVKREQFSEFRERISTFISSLEQKGKEFCKSTQ